MNVIQMNTTPGAPTEAQIEQFMTMKIVVNRKETEIPQMWFKRADVLDIVRKVISLHPAPSAALAALVASPEPVDEYWLDGPYNGIDTPSPPTTPPAAEPGVGRIVGRILHSDGVVRAAPSAPSTAQGLSDAEIVALPVWAPFVGLGPEHRVEIARAILAANEGETK